MKKLLIFVISLIIFIYPSSAFAALATLSLSPSTGTFNKGCSFSVEVLLDTGGAQTDGTDAILLYDTSKLTANPPIASGTIYSDYPGNNIDPGGKITISGLASVTSPFSGKGTLATVSFTVKDTAAVGATQITFDFDPNNKAKTSDSNVVERNTIAEILSSVVNGNYVVGSGSCTQTISTPPVTVPGPIVGGGSSGGSGIGRGAVGTPSASTFTQPPITSLDTAAGGKTGTQELTATVAIVGGILTILGILGLALL